MKRSIALIMALFAVIMLVTIGQSNAQVTTGGGNGFRISPVRSEFTIEKGNSQQLTVNIENPTDASVVAHPVINDFISSDNETGEPRLILDDSVPPPKNSFKKLVDTPSPIELSPREKKDIQVTIRVPENASAGGYYGAIRFVPSSSTGAGNVGLTASVGTIVLVRVPGDLKEQLDLVELTSGQNGKPKSFFTSGDVSVITRIKNSGDIHLQPFGKVQIKNIFGSVVKEYEFNDVDPRGNILPGSIRKFEDKIDKPGKGWIGRYTIVANLGIRQGSGDLISASTTYWYMPIWSIIALLILIVAIAAGGYILYKRYSIPRPKHGKKK